MRMTSFFESGLFRSGLLLSFVSFAAYGQQTLNLPLGALPMQYNGSFAGEAGSPRFSSNVGLIAGRTFYGRGYHLSASYDQFVPVLRCGIGVMAYTRQYTNPLYDYNGQGFSAAVAPKISLGGKWTLSPSLDVEFTAGRTPARNPVIHNSAVNVTGYNSKWWRSRAGLLFNTNKFYIGYSVVVADHLSMEYTSDDFRNRA